jgi:hypothetical protein
MPYKTYKKGSGYKACKAGGKKCFSKKSLPKERAEAQVRALYASEATNESLNVSSVGSNLEFKSVIPTADKTEVSVFYGVKSDPGTDLVLIFKLGETAEDSDYLYGVVYDKRNPKGRPQKFEDPSSKEAEKILSVCELSPDDVEMAGQDAYERIQDKVFTPSRVLQDPYEESLQFEQLFAKIFEA